VSDRELGFAGLLLAGYSRQQARQIIRAGLLRDDGTALALVRDIRDRDPDAYAASVANWAAYGLSPPWEGLL
jgi:hypothetical protein